MGLFSRIKNWFKRTFSGGGGGSSSSSSRASRVSNYGGGGSRSYRDYSSGGYEHEYQSYQRRRELERQERKKKQQNTTNALASISKRTDALSSGRSSSVASSATSTGTTRVLARINERSKATPPDPKEKARQSSQQRATAKLKQISNKVESDRKSFDKATGNKYNSNTGNKAHDRQARINQKMQLYDPNAEKWEIKHHPIAMSASRGALSGVTFGGSELLAQRSKNRQRTGVEQYYQKNKNKWAEMGGEVAGSLVGFGLTGGASAKAVGKAGSVAERLVPKTANATKGFVARRTEKLASSAAIRRAAEKEAIKRFGAEGATKEVINQIARRRASAAMAELGKDAAINMTTGLASDLSHSYLDASKDGTFDRGEFARSMGTNAALNTVLGGATSLVPAFRVGRNFDDAIEGAVRNVAEEQADDAVKVSLNRRRRTDVRMPEVRPQTLDEAVGNAAVDTVERNADEAVRAVEPTQNVPAEPQRPRPTEPSEYAQVDDGMFAGVADDIPSDDLKTIRQNDTRQNLEAEAERVANEIPREEPDGIKVNKVAEDGELSSHLPKDVERARSVYEWNTGEKVEGGVRTSWDEAWNAAKEYAQSQGSGMRNRKSKVSVSQINAMDSDAERELRQKLSDEGLLNYDVVHTEELYDKVSKQMRDDPDRWVKEMIDINEGGALDFRATPEWQARVQYIMATVDPSADPASEIAYTEAFKLAKDISSKGGQTLNLRKNFVHLTEAGKRDSAVEDLAKILYKSKVFAKNHAKELNGKGYFDRINYIKGVLMENDKIKDGVEQLVKADNPDAVSDAYAELMLAFNKENPKSAFDVVQEIRYLNMLGNPKTHIRNVFGSGMFSPLRQISNTLRAGMEDRISKKTGLEVTKHGGISLEAFKDARAKEPTSEAGKKALDAFNNLKTDILGSAKYDTQTYTGRSKTALGKAIDFLSDKNSALLAKEDDFFKERAFRENYIKSYNRYAEKGLITPKIERKIEAEAIQEAKIATFNEFNELANFLGKISAKASDANASTLERGGGMVMNAVMPFTKVPANIMKQSMNYSPVGIVKGLSNIKKAGQTGNAELLNRAIDEYASGLTGTGIMALGAFAGMATNWFTTNAGKNDYAAKFKKAQGVQNYSVTVNLGGEKYSATLDWLVPTSATFFMGVELANQMKSGDFDILDFGGDWAQISTRLFEPVLETSMLSGLYSMLESTRNGYGGDDEVSALHIMLRETAQSYLNSLVPTMLGQAARTKYKSDLQITGEDDWEYFRNQIKSKTMLGESNVFGEALGADTTAYGDVKGQKENAGDYAKSILENFVIPSNIQKVDLDEVDQAKIKQYEDAVKNGADPQEMSYLFPKKQYKKQFTTGNLDVKLSNRDLSAYNQAKTTGGAEGARYALESIMFNRYTKDENGNKQSTADAYTPEQKAEIIQQFDGKSIRDVEKWVREQPQFKNSTEAEQRNVIDGLWSYSKQGKAQSAKRVGEQAVIKAQGGDVNEYNFNNEISEKKREALQPLVDSGIVTYEQAVEFARHAGKTYYYEDDEGGHSQTYYNKGVMYDYLDKMGYDDETKAALFNAFKAWNAKAYGSSSGKGRRRRGRRRRGYRSYGGGSTAKATVPKPKTIKANSFSQGEALVSKRSSSSAKVTPPTLKRVQAKIDLPTKR